MAAPSVPAIDLVVATVDRTDDLASLLVALEGQSTRDFRVVVVDQNDDGRVAGLLARHPGLDVQHLRSRRGLSHARNVGLQDVRAPLVAFPDDDCSYPPDLLERVVRRFESDPGLGGLSGRASDRNGTAVGRWPGRPARITPDTVWHTANSHTVFLRREVVEQVGTFDEALGLGSGTPWSSGEEIDYLVRALRIGARIEFDPSIVITHPMRPTTADGLVALGRRDGGSVGYVLGANAYPARTIARMLVRPVLGALVSLVLLDTTRARFHAASFSGRVAGLSAGRRRR